MDKPSQKPEEGRFYVTVSNAVQGPYDLDFIEAMVLSGIYPPGVPVCREGSEEWKALEGVRPADLPPEPVKAAPAPLRATPMPSTNNNSRNVLIVAGIVIFIVILLAVNNSSSTGGSAQSATPAYSQPQERQPTSQTSGGSTAGSAAAEAWLKTNGFAHGGSNSPSTADVGSYTPTPPPSYLQFNGKTYRVSDSDNIALEARQDEMDPKARALETAKAEAKELGDEIKRGRSFLDNTDQGAVDRFNEKVDRYNALNEQVERQVQEYNAMVDAYNAELVRVGTPVQ